MTSTIERVKKLLISSVKDRGVYRDAIAVVEELREASAKANDESRANEFWRYKSLLDIKEGYVGIFEKISNHQHMAAWCDLERYQIAINTLVKNSDTDFIESFNVEWFKRHIEYWQLLFPYRVFFSPSIIVGYYTCSICNHKVRPRSRCEHKKGKLYNGEVCHHVIHDAHILEVSFVTNPVQKYSVPHVDYDYTLVDCVAERLDHPLESWRAVKTKKSYPRGKFASVKGNDRCPCQSDKKFSECCSRFC